MPKPSPAPTGRKTSAQGKAPRAAALGPRPTKNPSPERATQSANSTGLPPGWVKTTHGEIRRKLLERCDVHTLLRLPTGIFYKPGVKANVLFFDKKPGSAKVQTKKLWVYDLRTNLHFTLKQKPVTLADFAEFLACYQPAARHKRKPTWSKVNPEGRWRSYEWTDLEKRDKLDLDLSWLKDESIEDGSNLPEPDELAEEMILDLQNALELLTEVALVITNRPAHV